MLVKPAYVNVTLWILQILTAAMFLFTGGLKLAGSAEVVAVFDTIGLGQWFRYVTGGVEVTGAILLLIPKVSAIGAALLAATMVGAIPTHLFVIGGSPAAAVVLLLITSTIAWKRQGALSARR